MNLNQIVDGQHVIATTSTSGRPSQTSGRNQAPQIMLVPATRQQQVVYQQALQQQSIQQNTQSTQQHYIIQPGGFDNTQHTYQVC